MDPVQIATQIKAFGDGPMPHWVEWKTAHPDVFPRA